MKFERSTVCKPSISRLQTLCIEKLRDDPMQPMLRSIEHFSTANIFASFQSYGRVNKTKTYFATCERVRMFAMEMKLARALPI